MNTLIYTTLVKKLIGFNRKTKQIILVLFDSIAVTLILLGSISLRLSDFYWPQEDILLLIFASPIIAVPIFYFFGLYNSVTRFSGLNSFFKITQAVSMYAMAWGLFDYIFTIEGLTYVDGLPKSIVFINWMFSLIVIGSSRFLAQKLLTFRDLTNITNIIIYGAGFAGIELSNALSTSKKFRQLAYVDDNKSLHGSLINGIKVINPSELSIAINKNNVKEIFLAMPSISRNEKKSIIENLSHYPLSIRSLPSLSSITEGKIKVDDLFEINIIDLLGRELITSDEKLLNIKIKNKVVLVTGAGGSIGSELCRQIATLFPKRLILLDISESSLYSIQQELLEFIGEETELTVLLGSVRNFKNFKEICGKYNVQTIYHAAAYKHVPMVELNQPEGVLNNVIGTFNAARAAIESKVETFVLISTDKAVRPTNTMGATKRVAELVLQGLSSKNHKTCFTMVRFGNVLDSSGSVVPLFKKQIKDGGPVTVTDKNVVRYFMTIPEAVELVIQAGAMGKGGDVFVLDMGKPVLIYDLAKKMIHLSGLKPKDEENPNGDIEIIFTGLRPGEKLFEELLVGNNVLPTENNLIMRAEEEMIEWPELKNTIAKLENAALNSDVKQIRKILVDTVDGFNPKFPI